MSRRPTTEPAWWAAWQSTVRYEPITLVTMPDDDLIALSCSEHTITLDQYLALR